MDKKMVMKKRHTMEKYKMPMKKEDKKGLAMAARAAMKA
jgi:hypothetical protein